MQKSQSNGLQNLYLHIQIYFKLFKFINREEFGKKLKIAYNSMNICQIWQFCLSKSTWAEQAASRSYSYFHLWMCLWVGLYETSWPNEKWFRPEIRYTHSSRPYLKMFFLFFEKAIVRPIASKNCSVPWIFRIFPRLPRFFPLGKKNYPRKK